MHSFLILCIVPLYCIVFSENEQMETAVRNAALYGESRKKVINNNVFQYYVPIAIHSVCAFRDVKVFVRQIIVPYLHRNSSLLLFITLVLIQRWFVILGNYVSKPRARQTFYLSKRSILLVTQCTIVLIRKNIGSINFISGEAKPSPIWILLTQYFPY